MKTTEDKLIRFCSQIENDDRIKNGLEEIWCDNLNWPHILQKSKSEGVTCLLYQNLLQFKDRIPQDIWNVFAEVYYINAYRNIRIYEKTNIVLSSFNKENLKVIPLKGVFLAEKVYNNIALRAMTDIDLLVKKEELSRIDKLLIGLGYESPIRKELRSRAIEKSYLNSMDYFKADDSSSILHVHWHIVNISLPTYMYTKDIIIDRFWESANPVKIQDTKTLQLAPHHLIMNLSEHALKHSFDRLILLSDINEVIKRYRKEIDWEDLIKEAIELGIDRPLFYSVYFVNHFLNAGISDHILAKIRPKTLPLLEKRFFGSIINDNREPKLCYFVYLNMVKGIMNKFRFIFRTLFPPPSCLLLFLNLDKPRVTMKDYLLFIRRRFPYLKNCSILLRSQAKKDFI